MSGDTCGRQIESFFGKVARNNKRSVGSRYSKDRLQTRICSKTSIFGNKADKDFFKQSFNRFRNSRTYKKKSNRVCAKSFDKFRFLQYTFSGKKEEWGDETSDQSEASQQVSLKKTLQNGYNEKSFKSSSERRLGNKSRFEGRLFSHKNFQKASQIPKVSLQRESLSIQSSSIWSDSSSSNFYKSDSSSCVISPKTGFSHSNISGRLVVPEQNKISTFAESQYSVESPFRTRIYSEQKEINFTTNTDSNLYWGSVSIEQGPSFSYNGKNDQSEISSREINTGSKFCPGLSGIFGEGSIMLGFNTQCQTVHETNPTPFTAELESMQNVASSSNSTFSICEVSSSMVVTGSEHSQGSLFSTRAISCYNDHRCQQYMGLGWSYEQPYCARTLVTTATTSTHKLFRNGGSDQDLETFSSSPAEQVSTGKIGQHYSCPVYQQAGRYQINDSLPESLGIMDSSSRKWHDTQSSSYIWQKEQLSRCSEPTDSKTVRMVTKQDCNPSNFQFMGSADDGFICNSGEQTNSTVLLMDSSSSSICNGCPVNCLAEHVCLCIPTSATYTTAPVSYATFQMHPDTDSSKLAKTALVSHSVTHVDCQTSKTAFVKESCVSGQGEDTSSNARNFESDCMAHIDQRLASEGFSRKSRKLLSASWRKGTRKDYVSKFRMFSSWCAEQQIDPYNASLKDCANFLSYKFHNGVSYRTLSGYRSMLSAVLPQIDKKPIGQHPYLIRLLRGVFNERPPVKRLIPEWDLPFVLSALKAAPFEPLNKAPLKYLAWKTCFLIAVTSFRRCSDLQSLKLGEGCVNVQKKGVTFVRQGLSKQDRPGHTPTHIFIPSFPHNKLLDPKRCLAVYLKRTEPFRNKSGHDETKLFLATRSPYNPVTSQTISKWIVNTIKFAYKNSSSSVQKVRGHSTRSVGPSWALFKGASLKSVMESADWSKENTFIKHYLTTVNVDFLQA